MKQRVNNGLLVVSLCSGESILQLDRTVGNETSYKLLFGQKPRVGLTALPLNTELIESISMEGQLNRVLGLKVTDKLKQSVT